MHEGIDVLHPSGAEDPERIPHQRPVKGGCQVHGIDRQVRLDPPVGHGKGRRLVAAHKCRDDHKGEPDDEEGGEMLEDYRGDRSHVTVTGEE